MGYGDAEVKLVLIQLISLLKNFQYMTSIYNRIRINDLKCNLTTQCSQDLLVLLFILVHKVEYLKERCYTHANVMIKSIKKLFVNDSFWSVMSTFCLHL